MSPLPSQSLSPPGGDEPGSHLTPPQCADLHYSNTGREASNYPSIRRMPNNEPFLPQTHRPISVSLFARCTESPPCHFLERSPVYTSERDFSADFLSLPPDALIAISDAPRPPPRRPPLLRASQAPNVRACSSVPSFWKQRLPFGERGGERRPNLIESKILQAPRSPVWHAPSVLDLLLNKHLKENILRGGFPEGPGEGQVCASRLPRAQVGFSCAGFPPAILGGRRGRCSVGAFVGGAAEGLTRGP